MTKKLALIIEEELCWGCNTCELACKQENNPPEGSRWIQVRTKGVEKVQWQAETDLFSGSVVSNVQSLPVRRLARWMRSVKGRMALSLLIRRSVWVARLAWRLVLLE